MVFYQQQVGAACNERAYLMRIRGLYLIEGDDTKTCVFGIRRVREGDRERSDGSRYEALTSSCIPDAISPLAALLGRFLIDLPGKIIQHRILDDLLVEGRIFATAVLPRIVDEELALGDAGGAKGVRLDNVCASFERKRR